MIRFTKKTCMKSSILLFSLINVMTMQTARIEKNVGMTLYDGFDVVLLMKNSDLEVM
jgi:hypothetical protein